MHGIPAPFAQILLDGDSMLAADLLIGMRILLRLRFRTGIARKTQLDKALSDDHHNRPRATTVVTGSRTIYALPVLSMTLLLAHLDVDGDFDLVAKDAIGILCTEVEIGAFDGCSCR